MSEHVPGGSGDSEDDKIIGIAQETLRDLLQAVGELRTKVKAGQAVEKSEVSKVANSLGDVATLLIKTRQKVDDEFRKREGIVHGYAVDMDRERDKIRGLLDRLRHTGGSGSVH